MFQKIISSLILFSVVSMPLKADFDHRIDVHDSQEAVVAADEGSPHCSRTAEQTYRYQDRSSNCASGLSDESQDFITENFKTTDFSAAFPPSTHIPFAGEAYHYSEDDICGFNQAAAKNHPETSFVGSGPMSFLNANRFVTRGMPVPFELNEDVKCIEATLRSPDHELQAIYLLDSQFRMLSDLEFSFPVSSDEFAFAFDLVQVRICIPAPVGNRAQTQYLQFVGESVVRPTQGQESVSCSRLKVIPGSTQSIDDPSELSDVRFLNDFVQSYEMLLGTNTGNSVAREATDSVPVSSNEASSPSTSAASISQSSSNLSGGGCQQARTKAHFSHPGAFILILLLSLLLVSFWSTGRFES